MKLTNIAILAAKGSRGFVQKVMEDQGVTNTTVYRWLRDNDDMLTKASVLAIIRAETGLTDDQILERETTEGALK